MKSLSIFLFFIFFHSFGQTVNDLIIKKVNQYRKEYGLSPLKYSPQAKLANSQMLTYMVETSTMPFDHSQKLQSSFGKTFDNFTDRIVYLYGNNFNYIGENLCTFDDKKTDEERANRVLEIWKNSLPHNALLLSLKYDGVCVGSKVSNTIYYGDVFYQNNPTFYCVLTMYK
jgi:uncharacterized protein YkwD